MRKSIRKTPFNVSVTYLQGGYSHNLIGSGFEIEDNETTSYLYINLSRSLNVRNKETNTYQDALFLESTHNDLASIQIDEEQIADSLMEHLRKTKSRLLQVKLTLRTGLVLSYSVKLQNRDGSIFLERTLGS